MAHANEIWVAGYGSKAISVYNHITNIHRIINTELKNKCIRLLISQGPVLYVIS